MDPEINRLLRFTRDDKPIIPGELQIRTKPTMGMGTTQCKTCVEILEYQRGIVGRRY
jgi:hypothetical protein